MSFARALTSCAAMFHLKMLRTTYGSPWGVQRESRRLRELQLLLIKRTDAMSSCATATTNERTVRKSSYPMVDVVSAVSVVLTNAKRITRTEDVRVGPDALQRTLAEDIVSSINLPAFRASIVDGYAIHCPDDDPCLTNETVERRLVQALRAGDDISELSIQPLASDEAAYVTTGGPVPLNATHVIKIEDTTGLYDKEGGEVGVVLKNGIPGTSWIREVGSDIAVGQELVRHGTRLSAADIGTIAAVGRGDITVFCLPRVGILSTGNEVMDGPGECGGTKIFDSNKPALLSLLRSLGCTYVDLGLCGDTLPATEKSLLNAFQEHNCDVVVSTGGVSMGDRDYIKPALHGFADLHFGRVEMKPGKPTTYATYSVTPDETVHFFGLPGNPASAVVTFHLFVAPLLRRLMNFPLSLCAPRSVPVRVLSDIKQDPERPEYHRVFVYHKTSDSGDSVSEVASSFGGQAAEVYTAGNQAVEELYAVSCGKQRSSMVTSLLNANGLLIVPKGSGTVASQSVLRALLIGDRVYPSSVVPRHIQPFESACSCGARQTVSTRPTHPDHFSLDAATKRDVDIRVLTVSDRCSRGECVDESGPVATEFLKDLVAREAKFHLASFESAIVPDDKTRIVGKLREWAASSVRNKGVTLVVTTGGTGFSMRDVTPEATLEVIEKRAGGLIHAMMASSLQKVPTACLSRYEAGIAQRALIINLPGSKKAVRECLESLQGVLFHAIAQLSI